MEAKSFAIVMPMTHDLWLVWAYGFDRSDRIRTFLLVRYRFIYLFKFNVCNLRPVPILQRTVTREVIDAPSMSTKIVQCTFVAIQKVNMIIHESSSPYICKDHFFFHIHLECTLNKNKKEKSH